MTAKSQIDQKLIGTEAEFLMLVNNFHNSEFKKKILAKYKTDEAALEKSFEIYFAEMLHGYRFVAQHIPAGKLRIIEIGAGLGLVSAYLQSLGHDVVALEPAALSFDLFETTKREIWSSLGKQAPVLSDKLAEELSPAEEGLFDFAFSVNVMEHIKDIDTATTSILSVLKPNGISVNSCPNYIVPYEPHYAMLMIPFLPSLTRIVFSKTINRDQSIWNSLNFINWFTVKKMARKSNATVTFEKHLIYDSLSRLEIDPAFMNRHKSGIVGKTHKFLKSTKLIEVLKFLPAALNTPMVFTYKPNNKKPK